MFQPPMLVYWKYFQLSTGRLENFMDNLLKERVIEMCEKRGITVNKLEQLAHLSQGSIKNWDRHMPSIDKVYSVAEVLEVSVDYLFGYEGDYNKDLQRLLDLGLTKNELFALIALAEQWKKED